MPLIGMQEKVVNRIAKINELKDKGHRPTEIMRILNISEAMYYNTLRARVRQEVKKTFTFKTDCFNIDKVPTIKDFNIPPNYSDFNLALK